jgi:hypothetical protein
MDYQERLIWGQFLPIASGCGYYAIDCFREGHGAKPWPLLSVMLALLVVQIAYLIVVAALSRPEPRDERTRLIEYKAYKVGYLLVMVLFFIWVASNVVKIPGLPHILLEPVIAVFAWFGVEAIRTGAQLVMYRASVRP